VQHKGSCIAAGELVCAPSSLDACVTHLAMWCDQVGRGGQWAPALQQQGRAWAGNPARSKQLADLKKSYRAQAVAAGVEELAAVPLLTPEEQATLQHLRGLLAIKTRPRPWPGPCSSS